MSNNKRNHPSRAKPDLPGTPTPDEIRVARDAAGLSLDEAAELVMHTAEQWSDWEVGQRRMHPIIWWAFQQRVGGAR